MTIKLVFAIFGVTVAGSVGATAQVCDKYLLANDVAGFQRCVGNNSEPTQQNVKRREAVVPQSSSVQSKPSKPESFPSRDLEKDRFGSVSKKTGSRLSAVTYETNLRKQRSSSVIKSTACRFFTDNMPNPNSSHSSYCSWFVSDFNWKCNLREPDSPNSCTSDASIQGQACNRIRVACRTGKLPEE